MHRTRRQVSRARELQRLWKKSFRSGGSFRLNRQVEAGMGFLQYLHGGGGGAIRLMKRSPASPSLSIASQNNWGRGHRFPLIQESTPLPMPAVSAASETPRYPHRLSSSARSWLSDLWTGRVAGSMTGALYPGSRRP